jgi:uncharacterized phiE125 gp8 family phage protein
MTIETVNLRYVYSAPTTEVLTVEDVKNHLRIVTEDTDYDDLIPLWIKAARERAELYLRMLLIAREVVIYADMFDIEFELNIYPINSITHIKYYDGDNTLQTLAASNYITDLISEIPRIEFENIPQVYDRYNAVQVTVNAGYSTVAAVPQQIKQAMLILIAHFDQNREILSEKQLYEVPKTSQWLMDDYRKFIFK